MSWAVRRNFYQKRAKNATEDVVKEAETGDASGVAWKSEIAYIFRASTGCRSGGSGRCAGLKILINLKGRFPRFTLENEVNSRNIRTLTCPE
jgi:hypothetical protein